VLYAEFTARPGTAPDIAHLLREYAAAVRSEPGNIAFDVYRRKEAPDRFFVFEIYRDRAAFEQHLAAEAGRVFNGALTGLIRETASELTFLQRAA
jgi:quinol monooxygenase YgiN